MYLPRYLVTTHTTTALIVVSIPSNLPTMKRTKHASKLIHNSLQGGCFTGLTRRQQINQRTCLQNRLCNGHGIIRKRSYVQRKTGAVQWKVQRALSCCRAVAVHLAVALPHNILQLGRQASVELFYNYNTVNFGN